MEDLIRLEERYEEVLKVLDTLESNQTYSDKFKDRLRERDQISISNALTTCARVGLTLADIDELDVIHVTGTKGKGSTCAYTESILRAHGYKTGFFSSPHLVDVRERIRINGFPIDKELFCDNFMEVYNLLDASKDQHDGHMPFFFLFMLALAYHLFLKEKVDVAIIEVGIGGEYDTTNFIRNPAVCGITSLDIDHVNRLGDTIESIAWHKSGIFKLGVPAITVPQAKSAMTVLHNRAFQKGCPLFETASSVFEYDRQVELGIPGGKQDLNAALAVNLCDIWIQQHRIDADSRRKLYADYIGATIPKSSFLQKSPFTNVSEKMKKGLALCKWPGRCQRINRPRLTYYLDGGHTVDSMQVTIDWFRAASCNDVNTVKGKVAKVLVFNITGERDAKRLMEMIMTCDFDAVVFCPHILDVSVQLDGVVNEDRFEVCRQNKKIWLKLLADKRLKETSTKNGKSHIWNGGLNRNTFESSDQQESCIEWFPTVLEGLRWATHDREPNLPDMSMTVNSPHVIRDADHIQVLCAGSILLIGAVLGVVDK